MPLGDSFRKKTLQRSPGGRTSPEVRPAITRLTGPPKLDELCAHMDRSESEAGRPAAMSWKGSKEGLTYLLTVAAAVSTEKDPTWMLHSGTDTQSNVLWIYNTPDTELISSLISTAIREDVPKAEIPESLKILPEADEDAEPPEGAPLPIEEFRHKYSLISRLGHGGMGVIYKARRKSDATLVALKVLHAHLLTDAESKRRFEKEATNCMALNHRNVVTVHEFGYSKHGQPYMAMEHLAGNPLSEFLAQNGTLELPTFINVFTQICDGLHHAHQHGVVHRDVKPSNIMIEKKQTGVDQIKIVDFGIAKSHLERNREHLTPTGNVLGSPAYIAPEQCAGSDPDPRSDIYSLGCVMYEALTGRPPFVHDNAIKLLLMHLGDQAPSLTQVAPQLELPAEFEAIIMRCLEKDPQSRYQTAEELGVDLWTFAATGHGEFADAKMLSTAQTVSTEVQLPPNKRPIMFRFKRFRGRTEMEIIWEGLNLARGIQRQAHPVTILLDMDTVCLIHKIDLVAARLQFDHPSVKKFTAIQSLLQSLIKAGAGVRASERWSRSWGSVIMPGAELLGEQELVHLIIESSGCILDY